MSIFKKIISVFTGSKSKTEVFQVLFWDYETLNKKSQSKSFVDYKINKANELINKDFLTVTSKEKTISGNKHNYESMAKYAWPDETKSNGLPYKEKDGIANPECDKYDVATIKQLRERFIDIGETYYITKDKKYADYLINQLKVWFINSDTKMNPNFNYGQFIPGLRNNQGFTGAICEAYYLIDVFECIELFKNDNIIDSKTLQGITDWSTTLLKWLRTSSLGTEMKNVKDNLGTVYDDFCYRIAMFVGDTDTRKSITNDFINLRLNKHIDIEGKQPLELKRTKAMSYSIYNFSHMINVCYMIEICKNHFYNEHIQPLTLAENFIEKYLALNKEDFPYQEIGDWDYYREEFKLVQNRIQKIKELN